MYTCIILKEEGVKKGRGGEREGRTRGGERERSKERKGKEGGRKEGERGRATKADNKMMCTLDL